MKKILSIISVLLVLSMLLTVIASCGSDDNESSVPPVTTEDPLSHTHSFSDTWKSDINRHWQACGTKGCPATQNASEHTFAKGVSASDSTGLTYTETCSVCQYQKTQKGASKVIFTFDDIVNAIYDGAFVMTGYDTAFQENGVHYFQRLQNCGVITIKVRACEATKLSFGVTSLSSAGNRGTYSSIFRALKVNGSADGVVYTNGTPSFYGWDQPVDLTVATLTLQAGINEITFEMGADVNISGFILKDMTTPVFVTAKNNVTPSMALRGEGTAASPWLIGSAEEFIAMNEWMNYDVAYAKGYYQMTSDVDFKDVDFAGITATVGFSGNFDGKGHVVKNLNVERILQNNCGLFGKLVGGTVKNLGVASGFIEGSNSVGALIGYAVNAYVLNCFNEATVKGQNNVGGIVGKAEKTQISNSFNKGKLRLSGRDSVGGIVGRASATKIFNCYNIGEVAYGTYSGQLVGWADNVRFLSSYYDKTAGVKNQPIGTLQSAVGIVGMTTEELMRETFVQALNDGVEDGYMTWSYGEDKVARLSAFVENAKISVFISSIDSVTVKDKRIETLISKDGGYKTVVAGSDKKSVVGLDGTVYEPLTDQKVALILDIVEIASGEIVGRVNRNIEITISGSYSTAGTNPVPNVVPGLVEWYGLSGNFTVTKNARIVYTTAALQELAERVQTYMQDILGMTLQTVEGDSKTGDIVLKFDAGRAGELGDEGYGMTIDEQVVIEAPTETGIFYGAVSIMQILSQDATHTNIPKGYIRDYPLNEMRGGMIDVARKFFSIDYVEEIGKYMSWFKLNTLHLHINDDGGERDASFVVESKKYPQLNQRMGENVWSQDDYRALQKELKKFGVNVITEIDTPGHAKSLGLIDPSLVSGSSLKLNTKYDECLSLVKSIYDEFLDGDDPIIQNAIVHIGTDEASNASKEDMRRYISDLSQYVLSKENVEKVVFWGNLNTYYGATEIDPENVITQIWVGPQMRAGEALSCGFDIINSTSSTFYLVPNYNGSYGDKTYMMGYADAAKLYDLWGGARDFMTHGYDNPSDWFGWGYFYDEHNILKGDPQVLGALFCNWNDSGLGFDYDLLELFIGYFATVSEKCWYGEDNRFASGEEFKAAFNKVGDYAPYANPRYRVKADGAIIASYDFEETVDGAVKDAANGYHATVKNGAIATVDGNKVLSLTGSTSLQMPFDGIGYPYTATFRMYLDGKQSENAILFTCDECTFYLNYNGKGVAFESGIYVYGFNVQIPTDEWVEIKIASRSPRYIHESTNITVLTVNGTEYTPTNLTNDKTPSRSSIIGTVDTFLGVKGYLDDLVISNKYQFDPEIDSFRFAGEGTEGSPYLIQTANDLKLFSILLNRGEYQNACFKLTADIDMTDIPFRSVAEFRGTLDGDGHVITNLYIDEPTGERIGFIGYLNGGTIKNLGIAQSVIIGKKWVGAFAGRSLNATLINCFSIATVKGVDDVGGLVGMCNNTIVKNAFSAATVIGTTSVGGIAGSANSSQSKVMLLEFDNLYSMATLKGDRFVGAIAGYDEALNGTDVRMSNLYYVGKNPVSGSYASRTGNLMNVSEMTDGTLLAALNGNTLDGYEAWITGSAGYPVFVGTDPDFTAVELPAEPVTPPTPVDPDAPNVDADGHILYNRDIDILKDATVNGVDTSEGFLSCWRKGHTATYKINGNYEGTYSLIVYYADPNGYRLNVVANGVTYSQQITSGETTTDSWAKESMKSHTFTVELVNGENTIVFTPADWTMGNIIDFELVRVSD